MELNSISPKEIERLYSIEREKFVIFENALGKSGVWSNFCKIKYCNMYVSHVVMCKHCKKCLAYKSPNGTSHLRRHMEASSCKKRKAVLHTINKMGHPMGSLFKRDTTDRKFKAAESKCTDLQPLNLLDKAGRRIDGERSASTVLQDVAVKEEYIDEENTLGSYDFDDPEFIADDPLEVSEDAGGCNTDTSLNLPQSDKKHTSKIDMGVINEAILRLDRVTANAQKSNGGLDDFEAFGRYVVTSLRRMRPERAVEAQREMREIVENAMKDIAFRDDDAVLETDAEHCMENDIPTVTSTPGQTNINEEEMLTGNDLEQITRAAVTKRKSNDDSNPVEETDDNNDVHLSTQDSDQYTKSKKQKLTRSEMMSHVMDKVDYMMGRVTSETERPDDAELLGRYISESLRKMPLHMALCVENDLYSVIVKYRLECTKKDSKISNPP